jgi:hypothetical protein
MRPAADEAAHRRRGEADPSARCDSAVKRLRAVEVTGEGDRRGARASGLSAAAEPTRRRPQMSAAPAVETRPVGIGPAVRDSASTSRSAAVVAIAAVRAPTMQSVGRGAKCGQPAQEAAPR